MKVSIWKSAVPYETTRDGNPSVRWGHLLSIYPITRPSLGSVWRRHLGVLENLRMLWAIKLIFCMVTCHDSLAWIWIWEPISLMQTGPTSQISIFGKKFHDGLTWSIFIRFGSNLVQRSLVSLWTKTECLKWLQLFFDLPARPTKTDQ